MGRNESSDEHIESGSPAQYVDLLGFHQLCVAQVVNFLSPRPAILAIAEKNCWLNCMRTRNSCCQITCKALIASMHVSVPLNMEPIVIVKDEKHVSM